MGTFDEKDLILRDLHIQYCPEDLSPNTLQLIREVFHRNLGYIPEIVIVRTSSELAKLVEEKRKEIEDKYNFKQADYIPELFGFFNCKEHFDRTLPTGIFLLMDRIANHPLSFKLPIFEPLDLPVLTVFHHEFCHLMIHSNGVINKSSSLEKRNFEEAVCEYVSYFLTFEGTGIELKFPKRMEIKSMKIEGGFLAPKAVADRFLRFPRPYPYKWLNDLASIYDIKSEELTILVEALFNATLTSSEYLGKTCQECERSRVYLLNVKKLKELSKEEMQNFRQKFKTGFILSYFERSKKSSNKL